MKGLISALLMAGLAATFCACIDSNPNQDVAVPSTTPDPFQNCDSTVNTAPSAGQLCCPNLIEKGGLCQQGDCIGAGNLCVDTTDCCGSLLCTDTGAGNGNKICR